MESPNLNVYFGELQFCDLCEHKCYTRSLSDKLGLGVVLLSRFGSELQEPPSPRLKTRDSFLELLLS
jgi:hypothetical protein